MIGHQIYFLHIAKTAGTSFRSLIDAQFTPEEIAPVYLTNEFAKWVKAGEAGKLSAYPFIRGHMGWTPVSYLARKPRIITMLRDPVARTVSHYRHIAREKSHWMYPAFKGRDVSIEEFLEHPPARRLISNFQTRNMADMWDLKEKYTDDDNKPLEPSLGRLMAYCSAALEEPDLFMLAQERMAQCAFVGVTERFKESVARLEGQFGWKCDAAAPDLNRAPEEEMTLAPETRRKIEELTQLDRALYEAGMRALENRKIGKKVFCMTKRALTQFATRNSRNSPGFLGIGAQKAGTTWLYAQLARHPGIYMPAKEVHFWDIWHGRGLDWYTSLFPHRNKAQGEITPSYALLPERRIQEVHAMNSGIRLLFIRRTPKERAWSHALMELARQGREYQATPDKWFEKHFRSEASRRRGDYENCLARWRSVFPEEQLLVLECEDISRDPRALLMRVARHIGIDPDFFNAAPEEAIRERIFMSGDVPMRPSLRRVLDDIYGT